MNARGAFVTVVAEWERGGVERPTHDVVLVASKRSAASAPHGLAPRLGVRTGLEEAHLVPGPQVPAARGKRDPGDVDILKSSQCCRLPPKSLRNGRPVLADPFTFRLVFDHHVPRARRGEDQHDHRFIRSATGGKLLSRKVPAQTARGEPVPALGFASSGVSTPLKITDGCELPRAEIGRTKGGLLKSTATGVVSAVPKQLGPCGSRSDSSGGLSGPALGYA